MVFQHFKLVENFSVLENIVLGAESGAFLAPSLRKARAELDELAAEYELNVDPDAVIEEIGVGMQQRVEILKALYRKANILILDEPTGVLTPAEAAQLFRILGRLREEGKTVIFITHKLREIMEITDTVSVMRRGEMTATVKTNDTSPENLAELMVGRKVLLRVDKTPAQPKHQVLEVSRLNVIDDAGVQRLRDVSLNVRAGEILGVAGVAGNGQSVLSVHPNQFGHLHRRGDEPEPAARLHRATQPWPRRVFRHRRLYQRAALARLRRDHLRDHRGSVIRCGSPFWPGSWPPRSAAI